MLGRVFLGLRVGAKGVIWPNVLAPPAGTIQPGVSALWVNCGARQFVRLLFQLLKPKEHS
jgi:hypothetical protein